MNEYDKNLRNQVGPLITIKLHGKTPRTMPYNESLWLAVHLILYCLACTSDYKQVEQDFNYYLAVLQMIHGRLFDDVETCENGCSHSCVHMRRKPTYEKI